ncbi:hypothetical protein C1646_774057 [Rhizophagus diaphanus]|nr:hypothetical protein C1646_774057 [Rhizophagus diaphanus] [Rhizophagus sp. MUCL 43196]
METYENQIKYNDDGLVNVPFGHAVEWYISNANLLKNYCLKNQSRQVTLKFVKAKILTVEQTHRTFHNNNIPKISRINLTYFIRNSIALSRRADCRTAKGIKVKLLISLNDASEEQFVIKDDTGSWTQLDSLVNNILKSQDFILYY